MPTEREYLCRACREPFRTTKSGKGVFYCHRPDCDERRARDRVVTPNKHRMRDSTVRTARKREAAAKRERDLAARMMRDAHTRALRIDRQRAPLLAKIAKARKTAAAAGAVFEKRRGELRDLNAQLAELMGRPAQPAPARAAAPVPTLAPEPRRPPHEPTGDLADLISRTQTDVLRRSLTPSGDRRVALRRAVVVVANAKGASGMRVALHALAVEALAWEHQLHGGGRELGTAAKDAAA